MHDNANLKKNLFKMMCFDCFTNFHFGLRLEVNGWIFLSSVLIGSLRLLLMYEVLIDEKYFEYSMR